MLPLRDESKEGCQARKKVGNSTRCLPVRASLRVVMEGGGGATWDMHAISSSTPGILMVEVSGGAGEGVTTVGWGLSFTQEIL